MASHHRNPSDDGLVPPQQPSTPAGSECPPSLIDNIASSDPELAPVGEQEKLSQAFQALCGCIKILEEFAPRDEESEAHAHAAATKTMTELINVTNKIYNTIAQLLSKYGKQTQNPSFVRPECLEDFITKYNGILSVLLEVPSHVKFGLKSTIFGYLSANEAQWYRRDLERKLIRSDEIRAQIETKIRALEDGAAKERDRPADDFEIKKTKFADPTSYDTRPKRFNTSIY
ncbi:hypothetical protein DRE_02944 [Drechslerella stenobrocha 248]|uniref:Uncharacterized protein n=1 Tax=Drechslerella stenobrocha 248 TaxID=1043628 RepID=W7HW40_9PEZI|nr:hypothetical protein DRE_02944 [Drechslerella stenobrocha 248]